MSDTVPITFTVNVPKNAILQAGRSQADDADQALRDRAISQAVATFAVTQSFALIHVAVGAMHVDMVEKAQPMAGWRTAAQNSLHKQGLEELIPGIVGSFLALVVMFPTVRLAMNPESSRNVHKSALIISFLMNFLWCAWFAIMCGVYSREPENQGRVEPLSLILAIINFIFMIFNALSSTSTYQQNQEAHSGEDEDDDDQLEMKKVEKS